MSSNALTNRLLAAMIDLILVGVPVYVIKMIFSFLGWFISWIPVLRWFGWLFYTGYLMFFAYAAYEIIMMEVFQTTVGKKIMGVRVQSQNGLPLTTRQCVIRGVAKAASIHWFWGLAAVYSLYLMVNNSQDSLHDRLAESRVEEC